MFIIITDLISTISKDLREYIKPIHLLRIEQNDDQTGQDVTLSQHFSQLI